MQRIFAKAFALPLFAVLGMPAAWALDANEVRGGWETSADGAQHIYNFEIRGERVTGVYCTDCADATTLAFVDGTLEADEMRFVVNHVRDDGSTAYQDHVSARIEDGHLAVSGRAGGPGGGAFHWAMHKDPRGPAPFGTVTTVVLPQPSAPAKNVAADGTHNQAPPLPRVPRGAFGPAAAYEQPGPWAQVTPEKLVGVWFAGTGHRKQHFIFHKVGDRLLGMVCGPCDNPYTMAAIDDFNFQGDTVTFDIHHEDFAEESFGVGTLPFHNVITAHLAGNELRIISAIANDVPVPQQPLAHAPFSMIGPVSYQATAVH
jgi:hypothetical protein